jgi:cell division protein FtsL
MVIVVCALAVAVMKHATRAPQSASRRTFILYLLV